MPDITGRLRPPRLAAAPASPALGELYFDTGLGKLLWWSGTAWIDSTGGGGGNLASTTAAKLYMSNTWYPASNAYVKVPFDTAFWDLGGNFAGDYMAPSPGLYHVDLRLMCGGPMPIPQIIVWLHGGDGYGKYQWQFGNTDGILAVVDVIRVTVAATPIYVSCYFADPGVSLVQGFDENTNMNICQIA